MDSESSGVSDSALGESQRKDSFALSFGAHSGKPPASNCGFLCTGFYWVIFSPFTVKICIRATQKVVCDPVCAWLFIAECGVLLAHSRWS